MGGPPFSLRAKRYAAAMRHTLLVISLVSLAACGKADNDPGPGGVTVGEARALDEAAEMIEAQKLPAELVAPPQLAPSADPAKAPQPAATPTG